MNEGVGVWEDEGDGDEGSEYLKFDYSRELTVTEREH